ncbi:hypothetical protein [uncultured Thiodictyon sp.]|uniref:hypothetical protein n=1 Tax=uncultured Thiodictyon sp. TaxID=1846217 RepID=UPI0025DF0166|nr:hypothetical protein [uncultured Thiodictyon sp.]
MIFNNLGKQILPRPSITLAPARWFAQASLVPLRNQTLAAAGHRPANSPGVD